MNTNAQSVTLREAAERLNHLYAYCVERWGDENVLTRDVAFASNAVAVALSQSPAPEQSGGEPTGDFAIVPLKLTREMELYLMEDDWDWPELLAIAGTVSEEKCDRASELAATPTAEPVGEPIPCSCAECGKTSTKDSMWALYCLDCIQAHGIGSDRWIDMVKELCPEGIEQCCDECGGDDARCFDGCSYKKARAMLSASPAAPEAAKPASEEDMKVYKGIAENYFRDTAKPEQQAQAGEPEVVAQFNWGKAGFEWLAEYNYTKHHKQPLITLQSHREAMAVSRSEWSQFHHLMKKHGLHPGRTDGNLLEILDNAITKKDAALKACVEALFNIDGQVDLSKYPSAPPDVTLLDEFRAAINQAQEQLK